MLPSSTQQACTYQKHTRREKHSYLIFSKEILQGYIKNAFMASSSIGGKVVASAYMYIDE
jgi:hypothetical protein